MLCLSPLLRRRSSQRNIHRLLEYVVEIDLQILNLSNEPTFFRVIGDEANDIIMASADIGALVGEWVVPNYITLPDRRRIDFVMNMDPPPTTPQSAQGRLGNV